MSAGKSTAIADEPIEVLFALHNGFDIADLSGVYAVMNEALLDQEDETSKAFQSTIASQDPTVVSKEGVKMASNITFKEAYNRLNNFDVLIIVGGSVDSVLQSKAEPMPLVAAYAKLQQSDPSRERSLLAVGTGSMFMAAQGLLSGLSATMHPDWATKFEHLCSYAAVCSGNERTDVMDGERYVVNNLRYDLEEGENESPYMSRRRASSGGNNAQMPMAGTPHRRKGSMSFKKSNGRRESITRRAAMRLGGLRVITTSGMTSGVDASLYLTAVLVDKEAAENVAQKMAWNWQKGVVVGGLDV